MAARRRSRGFDFAEHLQRRTARRIRQGARMSTAHGRRYGKDRRTLFRQLRNRRRTVQVQGNNGATEGNGSGIILAKIVGRGASPAHSATGAVALQFGAANPTRRLPPPVRRGGLPVVRERGAARDWPPFAPCKFP